MADFGRIPGVLHHGAAAIGLTQCAVSGPARASATGIVNDNTAAVIIHTIGTQAARTRQDTGGAGPPVTQAEAMRDFVGAVRERVAKLIELLEQIATGRFSGSNLTKSLREQAEAINRSLDVLWENAMISPISATGMPSPPVGAGPPTHADTGQALTAFKEELEQINSSDGFAVGVYESRECLNTPADVEQSMTEVNAELELGIFSLAQVREQAMRALRCQAPEGNRVLFLLQNPQ